MSSQVRKNLAAVALGASLAFTLASTALGDPLPPGNAATGQQAWTEKHDPPADTASEATGQRSCARCHGEDIKQPGKHAVTGEHIDPLAPSVNPKRLTSQAKIDKWLGRNCRWVLGRACTPQEKADFLAFIKSQ